MENFENLVEEYDSCKKARVRSKQSGLVEKPEFRRKSSGLV